MTCILLNKDIPTKKALRAWIEKDPDVVRFHDPSIIQERWFSASDIKEGKPEYVTNHPKRSWFALIERLSDGSLKVS